MEPRHGLTGIIRRPTSPIVPNYLSNYAPRFQNTSTPLAEGRNDGHGEDRASDQRQIYRSARDDFTIF